jgi:putative oxidoreductase
MKIVVLICRILLGLMFVVFGLNILHPFMPMKQPPPTPLQAAFFTAMMGSGWMKLIGAFQVLGGLLVLAGGTLPLGLCILCPLTVNILSFHAFLAGGEGIGMGLFATLLELVLIYAYRASFAGILSFNQKPTV